MKRISITPFLAALAALVYFTACNKTMKPVIKHPTDNAVTDTCIGVPRLNWQEEVRGVESDKALKFMTELQLAAEADAKKGADLAAKGNFKTDIKSEFASKLNEYTTKSSKVSTGFWEQELAFRQLLCYYESVTRRSDVSQTIKDKYHEAILSMGTTRITYMFAIEKKNQN